MNSVSINFYSYDEIKEILAKRLDSLENGDAILFSNEEVFAQAEMLLE